MTRSAAPPEKTNGAEAAEARRAREIGEMLTYEVRKFACEVARYRLSRRRLFSARRSSQWSNGDFTSPLDGFDDKREGLFLDVRELRAQLYVLASVLNEFGEPILESAREQDIAGNTRAIAAEWTECNNLCDFDLAPDASLANLHDLVDVDLRSAVRMLPSDAQLLAIVAHATTLAALMENRATK